MGDPLDADAIGQPARWLVVFNREATTWWTSLVACGHFKHVRAFGYVSDCDAWIFYDVQFSGTTLCIARGNAAARQMTEWMVDADVLMMEAASGTMPAMRPMRLWARIWCPLLCTTTIASLLGLPGSAWRPDALYSQCLRHGARIPKLAEGESHGHHPEHHHLQSVAG